MNINKLKGNIINYTLLFGSVLGAIAFLLSLSNYSESGFRISYISDFLVVTTLITVSIFRKKIKIGYKSIIIILGLFILVITDAIKLGIYSDSKVLLIIIPFFSFLVYNLKKTLIIYSLSIFIFLTIGFLFIAEIITPSVDYSERAILINPWIINVLLITSVSFIIIIIVDQFNKTFVDLINDLKNKNIDITRNEQNYREIFNASSDAIFIHNLEGKILDINNAMLQMYGYDNKSEVLTLSVENLSSGNKGYTIKEARNHLLDAVNTNKKVFDWQAKRKNGKLFWGEVVLKKTSILGDEKILAIIRDIDEKKRTRLQLESYKNDLEVIIAERTKQLEATNKELVATNEELYTQSEEMQLTLEELQKTQKQLIQSEKMASIGSLAAGVAHEINNPLNFIQGGLSGLEEYFSEKPEFTTEETKQLLGAIEEGVNRTVTIVKSLNHFNRQGDSKKEICNVNTIIDNCLVILNNQIKNRIEVVKNYTNKPTIINGNDGKLHQAILNILTNAQQAIKDKGIINIQTTEKNKNIVITISDNGIGIKKENISRIFEPFFTTKEPGKGTGLGLWITYSIIQEHLGNIEYSSKPDKGTTVIITLPIEK